MCCLPSTYTYFSTTVSLTTASLPPLFFRNLLQGVEQVLVFLRSHLSSTTDESRVLICLRQAFSFPFSLKFKSYFQDSFNFFCDKDVCKGLWEENYVMWCQSVVSAVLGRGQQWRERKTQSLFQCLTGTKSHHYGQEVSSENPCAIPWLEKGLTFRAKGRNL